MKKVFKIFLIVLVVFATSVVFAFSTSGGIKSFLDASFILGLIGFIVSGAFYLKEQQAFLTLDSAMRKFGMAIIELFSGKDNSKRRAEINSRKKSDIPLFQGTDAMIGSAIAFLVSIIFSVFIYL